MKTFSHFALLCTFVLVAPPAFASDPDPLAGHHPAAATTPPAAPVTPAPAGTSAQPGCAMMSGKPMPGQMAGAGASPAPMGGDSSAMMNGHKMPDGMMGGSGMTDGKMAGCTHSPASPGAGTTPPK